jgi:hypothetical protein
MLAELAFKFSFISIFSLRDNLLPSLDYGTCSPSPSLVIGGEVLSPILSLLSLWLRSTADLFRDLRTLSSSNCDAS